MFNILIASFLFVLLYMSLWYLVALVMERNDVVDLAWGPGFVLAAFVILKLNPTAPEWRPSLVLFFLCCWALRLSTYVYLRNRKKEEDFRYAKWRKDWGKNFAWRSYFQIFFFQSVLLILVGLPVFFVMNYGGTFELHRSDVAGILLWTTGFLFEAIADFQMFRFKKRKNKESAFIKNGLWRFSRHPNYFGEAIVWWGFYCFALSSDGWLTIIGPITITFLLLRVSGVPLLENKYKGNADYKRYKETTSMFIPLPPRRR